MNCKFTGGVCNRCKIGLQSHLIGKNVVRTCVIDACENAGNKVRPIRALCGMREFPQTSKECGVYGRCLTDYRPNKKSMKDWLERPESQLYHLCYNCKEFKAKE